MPESPEPHTVGDPPVGRHLLGPHVVGRRVVVRHLVRGETGPSGGPALNDVLGTCTAWADGVVTLTREDGSVVEVAVADIVSGKPVPPRPSVRHRATPREVHLRSLAMWPDLTTDPLGDWVLRADPAGSAARANSVLAMGDPGLPLAAAADAVRRWYAERGRPAWAQVDVGSEVARSLVDLGWTRARPGEADTLVQIAPVARALRSCHAVLRPRHAASARRVADVTRRDSEEGPRVLVELTAPEGEVAAAGRAALDADWVGVHAVHTDPARRRQGLAVAVMAELLDWGASRGATTAYLQVREDNAAALGLYERLGFATHHTYRYLTAP